MTLYGLIVGTASVVWWSMAEYLEPRLKKIIPPTLIFALVGARIYHVIDYWSYYQTDILGVIKIWEGGLSIWGALIVGGGYLWYMVHSTQYAVEERSSYWSAVVTPLPLAQAIGRLANAVNGEFTNRVLGIPWWGMEAILDLGLFAVLLLIPKKLRVTFYLCAYILIRLVLEPYR